MNDEGNFLKEVPLKLPSRTLEERNKRVAGMISPSSVWEWTLLFHRYYRMKWPPFSSTMSDLPRRARLAPVATKAIRERVPQAQCERPETQKLTPPPNFNILKYSPLFRPLFTLCSHPFVTLAQFGTSNFGDCPTWQTPQNLVQY